MVCFVSAKTQEDWPEDIFTPDDTPPPPPSWVKFFPFLAIPLYYSTGQWKTQSKYKFKL